MNWKSEFKNSLSEALDTSTATYRIKDFKRLRDGFARDAFEATLKVLEVDRDFVLFLKKLSYDLCVLPVELSSELKEIGTWELNPDSAKELVSLFRENFSNYRLCPAIRKGPGWTSEKFVAVALLAALSSGYRGPVFLSADAIDPELGILNEKLQGESTNIGLLRSDYLPLISPGLKS